MESVIKRANQQEQLLKLLEMKVKKRKHRYLNVEKFSSFETKTNCHEELLKQADFTKTTPMSKYYDKDILKRVQARGLEEKYPQILKEILNESRNEFLKITHRLGVSRKIKPLSQLETHYELHPYKNPGKTERYHVYLHHRRLIKSNLLLTNKLAQQTLKLCVSLPEIFMDFRKFRTKEPITLEEFQKNFEEELILTKNCIYKFYQKIVNYVKQDNYVGIDEKNIPRYLSICSGLLSIHLSRVIVSTIQDVVEVIKESALVPIFKISVTVNNVQDKIHLAASPAPKCLADTFQTILRKIVDIANNLPLLQTINSPELMGNIPLFVSEEFLAASCKHIEEAIEMFYEPLLRQVSLLEQDFYEIYQDHPPITGKLLECDITFDKGCEYIRFYREYVHKMSGTLSNEYYNIGTLQQSDAISCLKKSISIIISVIFTNLFNQHEFLLTDICELFEVLKSRATRKPSTTEELIEMGEYMSWANTNLLEELQVKICESLQMAVKLLELDVVPREHLNLQVEAFSWLRAIPPIIDYNTKMYEQVKAEFEDLLQKRTEEVQEEVLKLQPYIVILDDMDDSDKASEYLRIMGKFLTEIKRIDKSIQWINKEEVCFKFQQTVYSDLNMIKNHIYNFHHLLSLCHDWLRIRGSWLDGSFDFLVYDDAEIKINNLTATLKETQKNYKNSLRQAATENNVLKFKGSVDDPEFVNLPAPLKLCQKVSQQLNEFMPVLKLMSVVCNDALLQNHWDEMSEIAKVDLTPNAGSTLRKYYAMDLIKDIDKYEVISAAATKERQILLSLQEMQAEWDNLLFVLSTRLGLKIVIELENIEVVLDDHMTKTSSMLVSVFVKPHEGKVKNWLKTITRIGKGIEELQRVQDKCLYLLPFFSSNDIVAQIPREGRLFHEVEGIFNEYITSFEANSKIIDMMSERTLKDLLHCSVLLESIHKGIAKYTQAKKMYFPRFYFLSDTEVLDILAETKEPKNIQISKCFGGIDRLKFEEDFVIQGMVSKESEFVEFETKVNTKTSRGSVEKWLLQVEKEMVDTLHTKLVECKNIFGTTSKEKLILGYPEQIVIIVSQVFWTAEIHDSLKSSKLVQCKRNLETELNIYIQLLNDLKLTNHQRNKTTSLVLVCANISNIINNLANTQANDNSFTWLSQLRYYLNKEIEVHLMNLFQKYTYEYMGNTPRIVLTPLTDRCSRTLILAHHLHLGGALQGPSGTGKSEIIKDLARTLGRQCIIFNCSEGVSHKTLGMFMKGLATAGAWVCFNHFDRLRVEVLSVIGQQILSINLALKEMLKYLMIEGTRLELDYNCFVCATLCPEYRGRNELPFNLKVLFRPITMTEPDYRIIIEISLISYGFCCAKKLSQKLFAFQNFSQQQISFQNYHDCGLRTIKSILLTCKSYKLKYRNLPEDNLLLKAISKVTLPKYCNANYELYKDIISDLFPGKFSSKTNYEHLQREINNVCNSRKLELTESLLTKIIQIYETMELQTGIIIIGNTLTGKTTLLSLLAESIAGINGNKVDIKTLNPKSISIRQLYGYFDTEWRDGIMTNHLRLCKENKNKNWIVFDGSIDPYWIENLNTALDDNKCFCLTSGETIIIPHDTSLIFEVVDLALATPATITRCGVVFFEDSLLTWDIWLTSWIKKCESSWCQSNSKYIQTLLEWFIPPSLNFIYNDCHLLCHTGKLHLVKATVEFLEMVANNAFEQPTRDDESKYGLTWIQASCISAGVWGLGGMLDDDSRIKFDEFYRQLWKNQIEEFSFPDHLEKIDVLIPSDGFMTDYTYNFKNRGNWKHWPDVLKTLKPNEAVKLHEMLVPTVESEKYLSSVEMNVRYEKPTLLIGPAGSGKNFYLNELIKRRLNEEKYTSNQITCTASLNSNQLQRLILTNLFKRKQGFYTPAKGKTCVIFIHDINVLEDDSPLELIRQLLDQKYLFDSKSGKAIYFQNIVLLSAASYFNRSKQELPARFLRHFSIFSVSRIGQDSLTKIFGTLLNLSYKNSGFPTDVTIFVSQIVSATLEAYKSVVKNLKPTPNKNHYNFNLRDISRVIFGCCMLKRDAIEDKLVFGRIWLHELLRVFYDRLNYSEDQDLLFNDIRRNFKQHFTEEFDTVFEYIGTNGHIAKADLKKIIFSKWISFDKNIYEEITKLDNFKNLVDKYIREYNAGNSNKINFILFRYALENLAKISRITSMSCGNCILIGISGIGRRSLIKLASIITNYKLFNLNFTNGYSLPQFRDDLRMSFKESGGIGNHCILQITEEHLIEEAFLEDIDCFLNSGEIPNLYDVDEQQEILEMVRISAQGGNRKSDISSHAVFSFFSSRCKENLHLIMNLSSVSKKLGSYLRKYPSLVKYCTIIWLEDWPEEALDLIGTTLVSNVNIPDVVKELTIKACKYFHKQSQELSENYLKETKRYTYITPINYLDLLKLFVNLIVIKQKEITEAKNRFLGGLQKLEFAAEQIANMTLELSKLKPELQEMSTKASGMAEEIVKEAKEVAKASNLVKRDEEAANKQAAEAEMLKSECEADLALAIPILEDAISALNTLKPSDITLVKSMKNPPNTVKLVMAAICVIKDIKPDRIRESSTGRIVLDYWGPSKRLLGEMNFLQQLKEFNKDDIKPDIIAKIRKEYLPHKDFKPRTVAKASSAAEGLCKWIIAMEMYDKVAKEVAPKKAKLEQAEKQYAATMEILTEKKQQVALLEERLEDLNENLRIAHLKQTKLEDDVELCTNKLRCAEKLIGGLGGEKVRWTSRARELQSQYDCLAGDILLSSGIISYLAPFSDPYRNKTVADWHRFANSLNIPSSENFRFIVALGSDVKIQNWRINGLPNDSFSAENAVIVDVSQKHSLMIDPQNQANLWIKEMERKNDFKLTKTIYPDFHETLTQCLEFGTPLLLENIADTLPVTLDPILLKSADFVTFENKIIPFNKDFKLYVTSNMPNPHYLPEVFNKVTVINFSLTTQALQDQLLNIVVSREKPELQSMKEDILKENAQNKAALSKVEENILKTLTESEGDILENEKGIQVLESSKQHSESIKTAQINALSREKHIESLRSVYKPVSNNSSLFYQCIFDLSNLNPMYKFSLEWFINLYIKTIESSGKGRDVQKRLNSLIKTFRYNLYTNVSRSLFEKDKLLFSFILCTRIMLSKTLLQERELTFFLTQNKTDLYTLPSFEGFKDAFLSFPKKWRNVTLETFPGPWRNLTTFQKLLVIKTINPSELPNSITKFIQEELGEEFTTNPQFNISDSFNESTAISPLIFILSNGTDPISTLVHFSLSRNIPLQTISLGENQELTAEQLILQCRKTGSWVCLQNCQMSKRWLPTLENIWEKIDATNTNTNFRLWLTSTPINEFPINLLQSGIKISNERQLGVKQNLLKAYLNEPISSPKFYRGCPKEKMFTRLLFSLAFFHAIVHERRQFCPVGWSRPYLFTDADFVISITQLQELINEYEVPYEAISYVVKECIYGGRISDFWDLRLLETLLNSHINPNIVDEMEYRFSESDRYKMPLRNDYEECLMHINKLSLQDPPELFGLNRNTQIKKNEMAAFHFLNDLRKIQGKDIVSVKDVNGDTMHTCSDLLSKLPNDINSIKSDCPINNVLHSEIGSFNRLLNELRGCLGDVLKALTGLVPLDPDLEKILKCISLNLSPVSFLKFSYPTLLNLPNYIKNLIERTKFIEKWSLEGLPKKFWLPALFHPQAFLVALKQDGARKYKIPIEDIIFDFDISSNCETEGIFLEGLYLDGAAWDSESGVLKELRNNVLFDSMPSILINPIANKNYTERGRYTCPLYKNWNRNEYVMFIMLNTEKHCTYWIKRGVALLCEPPQ